MTAKKEKKITIFILDDEKDICHFMKEFLKKREFDVYVSLTAKSAISTLKKIQPHIAFLDIRLADHKMTGLDILEIIKERHAQCQCVIVSYLDDPKVVERALSLGANDYLKKPLSLVEIHKVINKIVKKIRGTKN